MKAGAQAAIAILAIMLQDSAQRLHISAQRIIISSLPIFMHMSAQAMHISAHIAHILGHIGDIRIMQLIAISHMSAQSWSMHAISAVIDSIFPQVIIVSIHIDMHMPQSLIHRDMAFMSIFIMSIAVSSSRVDFGPKAGPHCCGRTYSRTVAVQSASRNRSMYPDQQDGVRKT